MSWDADLHDDRGHCEGDWNYTHNTNRMIHAALERCGIDRGESDLRNPIATIVQGGSQRAWFDLLDGLDGPTGAAFLHRLIVELEADPPYYEAMNPENGWGDYDSLLVVLREMRDGVPEWPCTWSASG